MVNEKEDNSCIAYLTTEQISNVLEAAKADQCSYVYLFMWSGLSHLYAEWILSIQIKNIDLNRRVIFIPQAKTATREQPILQYLADFLKKYIESRKPDQI